MSPFLFSPIARRGNKQTNRRLNNVDENGVSSPPPTKLAVVLGSIENVDPSRMATMPKYQMQSKSPNTGTLRSHTGVLVSDMIEDLTEVGGCHGSGVGYTEPFCCFEHFRTSRCVGEPRLRTRARKQHFGTVKVQNGKIRRRDNRIEVLGDRIDALDGRVRRRDNRIASLAGDVAVLQFQKKELEGTVNELMDQVLRRPLLP